MSPTNLVTRVDKEVIILIISLYNIIGGREKAVGRNLFVIYSCKKKVANFHVKNPHDLRVRFGIFFCIKFTAQLKASIRMESSVSYKSQKLLKQI